MTNEAWLKTVDGPLAEWKDKLKNFNKLENKQSLHKWRRAHVVLKKAALRIIC